MTMLAAAFPTIQSPPATSTGCPLSEYGWMEAQMIGNLENMASPAPSAPLVCQSQLYRLVIYSSSYIPVEEFRVREAF